MLRRLKAWYFIIAFGVLWLGGGIFGYLQLVAPAINADKTNATAYKTACDDANTSYQKAQASFTAYPVDAQNYLTVHRQFQSIQSTMPDIYDMKTVYGTDEAKQREGLRLLYQWMLHGKYKNELVKWAKGYKLLTNKHKFDDFAGILGYEDTFTSIHLVQVDFGEQDLTAYGYGDLMSKLQQRFGYAHFPLLITAATSSAASGAAGGGAAGGPAGGAAGGPAGGPAGGAASGPSGGPMGGPAGGAGNGAAMPNHAPAAMLGANAPNGPPKGGGAPSSAPSPAPAGGGASAGGGAGGDSSFGTLTITANPDDKHSTPSKPALQVAYNAKGYFFLKGWDPDTDVTNHVTAASANLRAGKALPTLAPGTTPPFVLGFLFGVTVPQVGPTSPTGLPGAGAPAGAHAAGRPPMPMGAPAPGGPPPTRGK